MSGVWLLGYVIAERILELVVAKRNTAKLLANGGREESPRHYPLIVLLHGAWLSGLVYLGPSSPISAPWFGVYVGLQVLRFWVLLSIGRRWTTRIIVVPGETLVARGPYRFLRHPNYCVVVAEIFALPMVFGLVSYALLFSALNALVLTIRIRAESRALAGAAS